MVCDGTTHRSQYCTHTIFFIWSIHCIKCKEGWSDKNSSISKGSFREAGLILKVPIQSQQVAVLINGAWLLSAGRSSDTQLHTNEKSHTVTHKCKDTCRHSHIIYTQMNDNICSPHLTEVKRPLTWWSCHRERYRKKEIKPMNSFCTSPLVNTNTSCHSGNIG